MKYVFIVQSEGRGHLTQAIEVANWLHLSGHQISKVLVGRGKRVLPEYFTNYFGDKITYFDSPYFCLDRSKRGIRLLSTFFKNIIRCPFYVKSIFQIRKHLETYKPNVVLNFYDILGGLAQINKPGFYKYYVISHHYYLEHPDFKFPSARAIEKNLLLILNSLTGINATYKLALSFRAQSRLHPKIKVIPPIIGARLSQFKPKEESHYLCYSVNPGYFDELCKWHLEYPEYVIHYFGDLGQTVTYEIQKNVWVHPFDRNLFLELLSTCKAYLSTSGFESICEAMFYSKDIYIIPTENHFEQLCNALDAKNCHNVSVVDKFDLSMLSQKQVNKSISENYFLDWCQSGREKLLDIITVL